MAEEWDVEAIAIVGNQDLFRAEQLEKRLQHRWFVRDILAEILKKRPVFISVCQYADQIETGATGRETGGLDIKKEDVLRGADHIYVRWNRLCQNFLDADHVDLSLHTW